MKPTRYGRGQPSRMRLSVSKIILPTKAGEYLRRSLRRLLRRFKPETDLEVFIDRGLPSIRDIIYEKENY